MNALDRKRFSILRTGTALATIVVLCAQPAIAQQADPAPGTPVARSQSEVPIAQSETVSATAEEGVTTSADPTDPGTIEADIVVTGTSIRGVPPTGSNLISVTRLDVETVGAATTTDLLATLPQLNGFNTAPRPGGATTANSGVGTLAPALRGLPATSTLVLLNGHRLVGSAAAETLPDTPGIPPSALERVEVVADGASAIYGSDAIAGVINFITRKNFSGAESSVRYGFADDYYAFNASQVLGHSWSTGSALISYQYLEHDNILGTDRSYRMPDNRALGGIDTRSTNCAIPNVTLPQTGATLYAAPDLLPNTANRCDTNGPGDLYPASRVHSVFASARQEIVNNVEIWGDFLYSNRKDRTFLPPPVATLTIRNTNPFFRAPPGTSATQESVRFSLDNFFAGGRRENRVTAEQGHATAGFNIRLPRDFRLEAYGFYNWGANESHQPQANAAALGAAAAGTTLATALDPFGSGTNPAVAALIADFDIAVFSRQQLYGGAAKLDGPIFALGGGDVRIAIGIEARKGTFTAMSMIGRPPVIPTDFAQNIKSAFGELFIPLFSEINQASFFRRLNVSFSGRYDDYSDFGSTFNPKVGVNWSPIDGIGFRGSYGKSFRAPGLVEKNQVTVAAFVPASAAAVSFRDPMRGDAQVNTIVVQGGNPNLQPEKAETYSFGVDASPRFLPGLRGNLTYYNILFTDVIAAPPQDIRFFTDPAFASQLIRNPTDAQLASILAEIVANVGFPVPLPPIGNIADRRRANFGFRKIEGLDFDLSYRMPTGRGDLFAGIAGNRVLRFDTFFTPSSAVSDALRLGTPKWRFRGTLGLSGKVISTVVFLNYSGSFISTYTTTAGTIAEFKAKPYETIDLRVTLKLPEVGLASGTELALQINDLFDKRPPVFPAGDGVRGDINPIGRFVAMNLRKKF